MTQMLLADLPGTPEKSTSDTRAKEDELLPMEDSSSPPTHSTPTRPASAHAATSGTVTTHPSSSTATTRTGGEEPPSVMDNSSLLSPSPLKNSNYSLGRSHTNFLDITNHQVS